VHRSFSRRLPPERRSCVGSDLVSAGEAREQRNCHAPADWLV
jgi:hypothetical protein